MYRFSSDTTHFSFTARAKLGLKERCRWVDGGMTFIVTDLMVGGEARAK